MTALSIQYVETQPSLTGDVDGTLWQDAVSVPINQFLWCDPDREPQTVARLLYNDEELFVQYQVESDHIYAETTTLNGSVWKDSCVELFAAVDPAQRDHYVNFEANCTGTVHLGVGTDRTDRDLITPDLVESIRISTSVSGPTKTPSDDDEHWWAAVAIPFRTFTALTGTPADPEQGTTWYGNLHRLRSEPTPMFAAWNPVETLEPDFHQPSAFGKLVFD
jgi:hypothetical protein